MGDQEVLLTEYTPKAECQWLLNNNSIIVLYFSADGHEFEQAPGVGDGQGNLAC